MIPISGSNDENILLGAHSVHLGQYLIDDSISGASRISDIPSATLGDRVQFVKEQHARRRSSSLQFISSFHLCFFKTHTSTLQFQYFVKTRVLECLKESKIWSHEGRTTWDQSDSFKFQDLPTFRRIHTKHTKRPTTKTDRVPNIQKWIPCRKRREHWLRSHRTTWSAARDLWSKWNSPDIRGRSPLPATSYLNDIKSTKTNKNFALWEDVMWQNVQIYAHIRNLKAHSPPNMQ